MQINKDDNFNKSIKVLLALIIILFSILLSIFFYNKLKVHNIFDEIYYAGVGATNEPFEKKRSVLGNIPRMEKQVQFLSSISENGEIITSENYDSTKLPSEIASLSITFYKKEKMMIIAIRHNLSATVDIELENKYLVDKQKLENSIYIIDSENKGSKFITDSKKIAEYLEKYEFNSDKLTQLYTQGMDNILLKDWFSVYPSKFSLNNLGKVDIKTKW